MDPYWFCFGLSLDSVSTKEIILGTQDGQLFEMAVDEKDKREKYIKFLFELEELPEAFKALQVLKFYTELELYVSSIGSLFQSLSFIETNV